MYEKAAAVQLILISRSMTQVTFFEKMKVFAGIIAASNATLLFDSRMHLSEGARCFVDCERELIGSAFRCEIEWGAGTDDYYR